MSNSASDYVACIHCNGSASVCFASAADSGSSGSDSGSESRDLVVGAGISEEEIVAARTGCYCPRLGVYWLATLSLQLFNHLLPPPPPTTPRTLTPTLP